MQYAQNATAAYTAESAHLWFLFLMLLRAGFSDGKHTHPMHCVEQADMHLEAAMQACSA